MSTSAGAARGNAFNRLRPGAAPAVLLSHTWAWLAVPYLVLFAAARAPRWLREIPLPDYNCSVYAYACAVKPTLIALNGERELGFAPLMAGEIAATKVLAAPFWYLVEKACLAFKARRQGALA